VSLPEKKFKREGGDEVEVRPEGNIRADTSTGAVEVTELSTDLAIEVESPAEVALPVESADDIESGGTADVAVGTESDGQENAPRRSARIALGTKPPVR
jgi:hypothetical protein